MACAGAGAESTAAAAGNLQGITLKVASEIQRDSNNLDFSNPLPATK
jgi:hypothetical protein